MQAVLERHLAEEERDENAAALARELVDGVAPHRDSIDAEIGRRAPQYPVTASPGWTAPCSVRPYARCYTRPRRPGWPSPSGSSWHAPTVETRCDAS